MRIRNRLKSVYEERSLRNIARPRFYTQTEVEFLIKKAGLQELQNPSNKIDDTNIRIVVEKNGN